MAIKKAKQGSKENGTQVECYYFDVEKCKHCSFKDGCYKEGAKSKTYSVSIKSDTHTAQMDYMETEEFKELYSDIRFRLKLLYLKIIIIMIRQLPVELVG